MRSIHPIHSRIIALINHIRDELSCFSLGEPGTLQLCRSVWEGVLGIDLPFCCTDDLSSGGVLHSKPVTRRIRFVGFPSPVCVFFNAGEAVGFGVTMYGVHPGEFWSVDMMLASGIG